MERNIVIERAEQCALCVMRHTAGMCPAVQALMGRIAELEARLAELERLEQARREWQRALERVEAEKEARERRWSRLP